MAENEKKSPEIKKNPDKPVELWQNVQTPLTPEMIYEAVAKEYPKMFAGGDEFVKFVGGASPYIESRRRVAK